jgi:hypothetical protein
VIANWDMLKLAIEPENCPNVFQSWQLIIDPLSELFLVANSTVNFFIYFAFNPVFQKTVVGLIRCKNYQPSLSTLDKESQNPSSLSGSNPRRLRLNSKN